MTYFSVLGNPRGLRAQWCTPPSCPWPTLRPARRGRPAPSTAAWPPAETWAPCSSTPWRGATAPGVRVATWLPRATSYSLCCRLEAAPSRWPLRQPPTSTKWPRWGRRAIIPASAVEIGKRGEAAPAASWPSQYGCTRTASETTSKPPPPRTS